MECLDRQPRLIHPALHLRPMRAADWQDLYAAASDPLIWQQHPAPDRWQEPVFRAYFEQGLACGGALVAIDPAVGRIIGSSRYSAERAGPGEMEIGWTFLVRRYWGGAMNAVMKRLMLDHALHAPHAVERVIFAVGEHNLRSRRAMEKIGGRLTDRVIEAPTARHVVFAIDREAFAEGPLMRAQPDIGMVDR